MRNAYALLVCVTLFAAWAAGRYFSLSSDGNANPAPKLFVASDVMPLSAANSLTTNFECEDISEVVQAQATVVSQLTDGKPVKISISKVVDTSDSVGWVWSTSGFKEIWLRGSKFKLTLEVDPSEELRDVEFVTKDSKNIRILTDFSTIAVRGKVDVQLEIIGTIASPLRLTASLSQPEKSIQKFQLVIDTQSDAPSIVVHVPNSEIGPLSPNFLELKQGENYPWQTDKSVTLTRSGTNSISYRVRPYSDTLQLIAIQLEKTGADMIVRQVDVAATGNASQPIEFKQECLFVRDTTQFETYFAAIGGQGSNNHAFANSSIVLSQDKNDPTQFEKVKFDDLKGDRAILRNRIEEGNLTISTSLVNTTTSNLACRLFSAGVAVSESQFVKESIIFSDLKLPDGIANLTPRFFAGENEVEPKDKKKIQATVDTKTGGFRVESVGPRSFGAELGQNKIVVKLSRKASKTSDAFQSSITLLYSPDGTFDSTNASNVIGEFDITDSTAIPNTIEINLKEKAKTLRAGSYQLRINGENIQDLYGNFLESNDGSPKGVYVAELGGPAELASDTYPVTPGVTKGNAPQIIYPEFVKPRTVPTGFNPNDKVETRVARLYFYRDAHRVAQILNRRVQSYNRQEVAVRRQLADKTRQEADSRTTNRQIAERAAVQAAQRTRELENKLSDTQRSLNSTLQQLQNAASQDVTNTDKDKEKIAQQNKDRVVASLQSAAQSFASQVQSLETQVRSARDSEVAGNERWQQSQRDEDLARADQFRMETAAAHSDPDTFAQGDPESVDPVAQVSISVIGEGLIHLRGPLKGVNQVRMMVDQIDAPQGQVRINVHSTQINGDEADELEVVANRIQTYIDQARFMTVQSAEMLRKSVVHIAAMKAEEARGMYPGATQAERDQLYLYAFFGRDFVDELRSMDSELLHTGNKLLSLHSMDVTSLSSALMLLALANNGSRLAILEEFDRLVKCDLSMAEQQYIHNSIGACTGGCKAGCKHHQHAPPVCSLSPNASFTSLRGFFDSQIQNDTTMSPLQREAIGLAQILKARLITEMEYKQRVMERAVIEERMESVEDAKDLVARERNTRQQVQNARETQLKARSIAIPNVAKSMTIVTDAQRLLESARKSMSVLKLFLSESGGISSSIRTPNEETIEESLQRLAKNIAVSENARLQASQKAKSNEKLDSTSQIGFSHPLYKLGNATPEKTTVDGDANLMVLGTQRERDVVLHGLSGLQDALRQLRGTVVIFHGETSGTIKDIDALIAGINTIFSRQSIPVENEVPIVTVSEIDWAIRICLGLLDQSKEFSRKADAATRSSKAFLSEFASISSRESKSEPNSEQTARLFGLWSDYSSTIKSIFDPDISNSTKKTETERWLSETTKALQEWLEAVSNLESAQSLAQDARRPLDHKKFLDMLIDDLEEKYIELLEGTRAHTANIDNYLKRLTTSLDDDFNTQFYYPTFRLVREASQFKRVEFGQTETTNILVNNREFGKVSPSATMEFDLPKRDILIEEGLDSAMAIYNDVGALVNDPNLLALAKMQSGSPPASGQFGGVGSVRSVLPGLNGSSGEQLLAQNSGSGPKFESNVEKLIPDPAVYKFETGTGYEIRPVIAPDGQAVVFDFHYLYTTQIREPVRADEKHLGRVKQHFIDTDVQLSNFELREVSRYVVALKAERTANGVPLLEDIPVIGALWRPVPNREKSLQQNIIMAQSTIFPTLFDLMGLRWAPAVSDLDPLQLSNREYLVRGRHKYLENRIYDYSSARVDEFLRVPEDMRRADLYRSQETISSVHPNGYRGQGLDLQNSQMREGYNPEEAHVPPGYIPGRSPEGAAYLQHRQEDPYDQMPRGSTVIEETRPNELSPSTRPSSQSLDRIPIPPALENSSSRRNSDGWQYPSSK